MGERGGVGESGGGLCGGWGEEDHGDVEGVEGEVEDDGGNDGRAFFEEPAKDEGQCEEARERVPCSGGVNEGEEDGGEDDGLPLTLTGTAEHIGQGVLEQAAEDEFLEYRCEDDGR